VSGTRIMPEVDAITKAPEIVAVVAVMCLTLYKIIQVIAPYFKCEKDDDARNDG